MSLLQQAPRFDPDTAARLAREHYGLEATAVELPSERDQNFRLRSSAGSQFVLKVARATEGPDVLEAQNAAMARAASNGALTPTVVPAADGRSIVRATSREGTGHCVRLLTWIEGMPLGSMSRHPPDLLRDAGRRLGQLDAALATFDHPALHRVFHWDLARGFETIAANLRLVRAGELRRTIEAAADRVHCHVAPRLAALRRSAIHNDANDYNVIVRRAGPFDAAVSGFIDFGDMVHGFVVADPAIAAAYVMLDKADPLAAACAVARGYHSSHPLNEDELSVFFGLAILRLCLSACIAASQTAERPDDEYLAVSQGPIERTLPRLHAIPLGLAEAAVRRACGFDPVPAAGKITAWLKSLEPLPVMEVALDRAAVLDLSVGSPLIDGDPAGNVASSLAMRIERVLEERGASMGVGRYGEPRMPYAAPLSGEDETAEPRTIHLGLDLFAPAGTIVRAPFDGVVALAADNRAPLDYGPLIVLEHRTGEGDRFYTLYGHLTRESLPAAPPGRHVAAGEPFAALGAPDVNGGWAPHLHVQVILDLLDLGADFPGVCRASEREVWQAFSPSPNLVVRVPRADYPAERLDDAGALASRRARIGPSVRVGYQDPLHAARGWMQWLFDESGRRYLDAYNNVPHVGHSHPRVAAAAAAQLRVLNTNTRYLYDSLGRYAERLAATLPDPLTVCYFVNSGTEANELALRLARAHTGRQDVLVLDAAYHGHSSTMIDVSPYKFNGPGGQGARPWVHVAALPDVYRGPYRREDAAAKYARDVAAVIDHLGPGRLAAFLAETCPSVAGQILLPAGYLPAVYEHVRAAGGVCIADEVQTAYGRTGRSFYAFTAHAVVPDIVVLGKPIGNGYPIGAVVTTAGIAASFDNGMEFFSTFGGSTVSCAVGLAVLEAVEEDDLQAHAARVGTALDAGLRDVQGRHALVGDVRGSGLFWGVELVRDRTSLEPAAPEASYVVNRLREEGILIGTDGPLGNVLKIRPPMPFDESNAGHLVQTLDRVLGELAERD